MPAVRLLATGGTIASRAGANGRYAAAGGAELLTHTPLPDGVDVSIRDVATIASFAWSAAELRTLQRHIDEALADPEVAGIVVTHGTDTMEEVSFLVSLGHHDPRPVVFTGAQRTLDDPAADGPANLSDALALAAHPAARDRGVLLCFDGHAYAARGVRKVDTLSTHGFDAPGRGPALRVAAGRIIPLTAASQPPTLPIPTDAPVPRVDVIPLYLGADTALFDAAIGAGAQGIVLAAFGAGNANPAILEAVRTAVAAGVPVLVCSRVHSGPVAPLYGGGGGASLAEAGAIFGVDLSPWQGRMLLAAALATGASGATGHADLPAAVESWLQGGLTHH